MANFLKKTVITLLILALLHLFAAWLADGTTDAYYLRLTSPEVKGLILGTSRAAQGIKPGAFPKEVYNFAFTNLHSPYGQDYLRAIKTKVNPGTTSGLFILSVDPWSIASTVEELKEGKPRESKSFLGKLTCFTCKPNFQYLFTCYEYNWGMIFWNRLFEKETVVKEDGWLEVIVPMDTFSIQKRTREKIEDYKEAQLPKYQYSPERMKALELTVRYLKRMGSVVLVRIPVSEAILEVEQQLMPEFNHKMIDLARNNQIVYLNFEHKANLFEYTDGNHLSAKSAQVFSAELARAIPIE